jgi:hypothetical protein
VEQGQKYHRAGPDGERRPLLSLSRPRTVAGRSLRRVRAAGEAVYVCCSSCRCCSSPPPQALAAKSTAATGGPGRRGSTNFAIGRYISPALLPCLWRFVPRWSFATRPYPEHGGTQDPLQEFGGRPTHGEGPTRAPTPEHPVSRDKKEGRGLTTPALFTLSDPPERVRLTRWLSRWPARWCLRPARWLSRQPPWRSTGQE